ncbi:Myb family DNA-binding domain-containing protein [Babesia caballi]|uniref:Myb family DNA-binding domain-containing protein n=1 Tax=Babesia caballi TaxID=5871 RepID=A0AAV4M0H6_BABCB|nr:Myb family DNA-binding domain-containing protein [Babesia caballi]
MRIQLKGGVWKNSEDEVLKAAVMKYGLNNWSRVSSLLVRKSAKQCKARWYEWLNPYVKKTEWSREEEEKLLHLAKLFPTQWRTIGPMIGRTAHQCLEHYERLLDQAQGRDQDDELDPRRLRPGEIDPAPETKPSRADAVDMDDDEKEMLAEARARLANTRGKKAKRKAREKQIEQTRRLASLQKRRELKNAGVNVGALRLHNSIMDYVKEVPFETQPPKGFYEPETGHEIDKSLRSIQQLEGKRRDEELRRMRNDDARKLKRLQEENIGEALAVFEKYDQQTASRSRLVMPAPTMTDEEIVQIVKMGADVQMFEENVAASSVARTPMTTSIMEEARMAAASSRLQTPLLGEPNVEGPGARGTGEEFPVPATPATPNPLKRLIAKTPMSIFAGKFSSAANSKYSETPSSVYHGRGFDDDDDDDPIGARARMDMAKLHVKATMANLPKPESQVDITLAGLGGAKDVVEEELVDDEGELERQRLRRRDEERERNLSSAIKQGVERPLVYSSIVFVNDLEWADQAPDEKDASEIIHQEFVRLVQWDSVHHPQPGGRPCLDEVPDRDDIEARYISAAEHELAVESARLRSILGAPDEPLDIEAEKKLIGSFGYSTLKRRYVPEERLQLSQRAEARELEFKEAGRHLEAIGKRNKALEGKCTIATGGYAQRQALLLRTIGECERSEPGTAGEDSGAELIVGLRKRSSLHRKRACGVRIEHTHAYYPQSTARKAGFQRGGVLLLASPRRHREIDMEDQTEGSAKAAESAAANTPLSLGERLRAKSTKKSGISVSVHGIAVSITNPVKTSGSAWKSDSRLTVAASPARTRPVDEVSFPGLKPGAEDSKNLKDPFKEEGEEAPKQPEVIWRGDQKGLARELLGDKFLMPGMKGTYPLGYRNFIGRGTDAVPPPPPSTPPPAPSAVQAAAKWRREVRAHKDDYSAEGQEMQWDERSVEEESVGPMLEEEDEEDVERRNQFDRSLNKALANRMSLRKGFERVAGSGLRPMERPVKPRFAPKREEFESRRARRGALDREESNSSGGTPESQPVVVRGGATRRPEGGADTRSRGSDSFEGEDLGPARSAGRSRGPWARRPGSGCERSTVESDVAELPGAEGDYGVQRAVWNVEDAPFESAEWSTGELVDKLGGLTVEAEQGGERAVPQRRAAGAGADYVASFNVRRLQRVRREGREAAGGAEAVDGAAGQHHQQVVGVGEERARDHGLGQTVPRVRPLHVGGGAGPLQKAAEEAGRLLGKGGARESVGGPGGNDRREGVRVAAPVALRQKVDAEERYDVAVADHAEQARVVADATEANPAGAGGLAELLELGAGKGAPEPDQRAGSGGGDEQQAVDAEGDAADVGLVGGDGDVILHQNLLTGVVELAYLDADGAAFGPGEGDDVDVVVGGDLADAVGVVAGGEGVEELDAGELVDINLVFHGYHNEPAEELHVADGSAEDQVSDLALLLVVPEHQHVGAPAGRAVGGVVRVDVVSGGGANDGQDVAAVQHLDGMDAAMGDGREVARGDEGEGVAVVDAEAVGEAHDQAGAVLVEAGVASFIGHAAWLELGEVSARPSRDGGAARGRGRALQTTTCGCK